LSIVEQRTDGAVLRYVTLAVLDLNQGSYITRLRNHKLTRSIPY